MAVKIQLRRGTASQWTTANPTLSEGEIGIETDTRKAKFGDGLTSWTSLQYISAVSVSPIQVAVSDETTAVTTGTSKITFRVPNAMTLSAVRASLTTAQASGNIFTVDINKNGVSILSTKLTIDNTEKTSVTATTPAVISTPSISDDDEITIDIDQIGNGTATGLKVTLIG